VTPLLSAERLSMRYGTADVLSDVSLGVAVGDRIGVVGRNGGGKSTLLRLLAGLEEPTAGRVARGRDVRVGVLDQQDRLPPGQTVREVLFADTPTHAWAGQRRVREVVRGLLGLADEPDGGEVILDRTVEQLSGGERRRVALAGLLIGPADVLLLDEPSNHLDLGAVAWLAEHLRSRPSLAVVVITHDRWLLDEVGTQIWEVVDTSVAAYEGGYSAFVLAKAERQRQAASVEARRRNLLRKELAWLRRGAPARTSKPKFRIDAATALIADEPPPRDAASLLRFATTRLGRQAIEVERASLGRIGPDGPQVLVPELNLTLLPGVRYGILGPNGAGKSSLLALLAGTLPPLAGTVTRGSTVRLAMLDQSPVDLDPTRRVREVVADVAEHVDLGSGETLSASRVCEVLGFTSQRQWTAVGDLSGGERHRLHLTCLLMTAPNVLLLDEPTNNLDVETLAALEDLLDGFAGTVVVVSHDRYFLERVCDEFIALPGDGRVRPLVGGVTEYLRIMAAEAGGSGVAGSQAAAGSRGAAGSQAAAGSRGAAGSRRGGLLVGRPGSNTPAASAPPAGRLVRAQRAAAARLERTMTRLTAELAALDEAMVEVASDHARLLVLAEQRTRLAGELADVEEEWLLTSVGTP